MLGHFSQAFFTISEVKILTPELINWLAVLAFLLGLIAIILEIIVFPGFGIAGIIGIILFGWGVLLASVDVVHVTEALVLALIATIIILIVGQDIAEDQVLPLNHNLSFPNAYANSLRAVFKDTPVVFNIKLDIAEQDNFGQVQRNITRYFKNFRNLPFDFSFNISPGHKKSPSLPQFYAAGGE
jgi:hypothetical protein